MRVLATRWVAVCTAAGSVALGVSALALIYADQHLPNGTLNFTVSDDGNGYDARQTPMGSGLRNMADRLAALGGRLEVQSVPGRGTTITGHLPIPSAGSGSGGLGRRQAEP